MKEEIDLEFNPQGYKKPRVFSDVINEWTDELLRRNKDAPLEQVALILDLGILGQRLIYEANIIGQNEVLRFSAEQKVKGQGA